MDNMDSKISNENKIQIRILAENGKHVVKNEKIDICSAYDSKDGCQQMSQASSSYLSKLSSTLKSVRQETNLVLTQFIQSSSSNIKETGDTKEIDSPEENDDVSDDDIAG